MQEGTLSAPERRPGVLVLGGTGCIGRHVCAAFARRGYRVLAVARTPAAHLAGFAFRSVDLTRAATEAIVRLLAEADAEVVVNATDAANATDGWDRNEEELTSANVAVAERLVEAMDTLPGRRRLVHIGTIHEYGPGAAGVPLDEDVEPRPVNAYARSKLAGSQVVLRAARAGAVDGVVLRLVNTCGPDPSPASFPGKLLPLLRDAVHGRPLELAIADAMRDWIDVRDVAEAAVRAAELPVAGQVFNIGSGVAVPMREVVALCLAAAGLSPAAVTEKAAPVRSLGADWIQADIRRARERLQWEPRISLKESLQDMWDKGSTSR
ncbi:NAD(P)-dependent oxidoreductase [Streptomyces sp. NPDC006235]|uniref:NAD-dependent epimerase/dehydratase family protein n=1 Tax=Streptomyces sp. NPDC006235 TaxID=3156736 RepID=UPI0033AA8030